MKHVGWVKYQSLGTLYGCRGRGVNVDRMLMMTVFIAVLFFVFNDDEEGGE
jgi:hypothetical protein